MVRQPERSRGTFDPPRPRTARPRTLPSPRVPTAKPTLRRLLRCLADHGIAGSGRFQSARELLLRARPSVLRGEVGTLIGEDERLTEAAKSLTNLLSGQASVLPIQGPPGSGKTFTGGRMIVELVSQGRRVGVTAASHKVVSTLLREVCSAAKESGVRVRMIQKASEGDECDDASVIKAESNEAVMDALTKLDWQDCPVAFKLKGLARQVISVKFPLIFPPGDMPLSTPSGQHWFIVHREDAAKVLLLLRRVQDQTERYLETAYGQTRLQGKYDWNSVVLDATTRRLVRRDFEIFFEREEWFRQHNLPYRRGYLFYGSPGNGKTAVIRIMASHPDIQPYTVDLSNMQEKSADVVRLFERAAENTPALIILEDLDRAFPTEGKRTQERTVSFQTLLNCLDGVGSQNGVLVVATANDPTCLDAAILKRPGRFDRVVQFRNPDAALRREYYRRLSPVLKGDKFELAIEQTEGFSFAQLRETYILGAQSSFEHGQEITVRDVLEAIELHTAGTHDLKTSVSATGFVSHADRVTIG